MITIISVQPQKVTGAMLCFFILLQSVALSRRNKKTSMPIWLRRVRGRLPQLHK